MYTILVFILIVLHNYFFYFRNSIENLKLTQRVFVALEFSFISILFYYNIQAPYFRKLILILIIPFLVYSVYDFIISERTFFNYYIVVVECLLFLLYIIYFFFEKIKIDTIIPIYQTSIFWIAIAFFIYSSGNFFLFLYKNTSKNDENFQHQYTIIYSSFTILKNILICIGLSIKDRSNEETNPNLPPFFNDWDLPVANKPTDLQ